MNHPTLKLAAVLGLAAAAAGCGAGSHPAAMASRPHVAPAPAVTAAPALYTDANGQAVWRHPEQHLGAYVDVRGRVDSVARVGQGVLVALALPAAPAPVAVHVFDGRFAPRTGAVMQVRGRVRGPLGSPDVPGVPLVSTLAPGTAVIDAGAASVPRASGAAAVATRTVSVNRMPVHPAAAVATSGHGRSAAPAKAKG